MLAGQSGTVQEYLLTPGPDGNGCWVLQRDDIKIEDKKIFAPANLRATAENQEYQQLVQYWMANKYTLRYSGGMVPDVHHILTKAGLSPAAQSDPRAVYYGAGALCAHTDPVA